MMVELREWSDDGNMGTRAVHQREVMALTALALLLLGTHAAEAGNEFGVAVVVGNKEYADARVSAVSYAHNDADAFYEFVVGTLGFSPDNVVDLRDATKVDMESAFGAGGNARGQLWRWAEADGGSDIVVFYSGHGVPGVDDGRGYLLPVDANLDMAAVNGYPIDVLYENLGKIPSKSVTVYLDACFSGGSGDGGVLVQNASPVSMAADVSGVEGMTVLTAASGEQLASWDTEARHGLFTEHLLDGLYGAADTDGDGRVTAREAKRHLDRTMTRAARRAYGREQDAVLQGDESVVLSFSSPGGWKSRTLLGPRPAAFTVLAEPADARVRILNIGEPYRAGMELAAGSYEVEASAPGHVTKTEAVVHGSSATVHEMVLSRSGQPLTAVTVPADAEVRLLDPGVGDRFRDCAECPEMVVVPAGSYWMGSPPYEQGRQEHEGPVHEVAIAVPFALGVYEVTVAEFGRFVDETAYWAGSSCGTYERGKLKIRNGHGWRSPGFGQSGRHPVACVTWDDAQAYAAWLSQETGEKYRLPSESEWEYAARAGTATARPWKEGESRLCRHANGGDASASEHYSWTTASCRDGHVHTAPVGSLAANGWGLHDMLGNVWEWTEDCWNDSYAGAPSDGNASQHGDCSERVMRGGSWIVKPSFLRSAARWGVFTGITEGIRYNFFGFRVARTLTP